MEKIGVLGGMGPEATVYLFDLIVKLTKADGDCDHIPLIIFNNPHIPDRTQAILGKGSSPLPQLVQGARILEQAGASFLIMPCVTAHYYYPNIVKKIKIPFLHMIEETVEVVTMKIPHVNRFGLLATTGSIKTDLFQDFFKRKGLQIVVPEKDQQIELMDALYGKRGIKSGCKDLPKGVIVKVAEHLIEKAAGAIIAGCTEIPLVIQASDLSVPLVNPLQIIAQAAIERAGYQVRIPAGSES